MGTRTGSGFSSLLLVVLLLAVVLVLGGIFPFRQLIAANREVDDAEQRLELIQEETAALADRVAALQTPEEVERLAREQFGLVMPGEVGYVVVTPPWEEDQPSSPVEPAAREPEERAWWQSVWDFLTGRDLAGDG
ncbi:MAG: septum formation initiator family protein [Actinobacteria bacterium]|nr:septum formation initiator family protein [Actinomycetota bacterium]